MDGYLEGMVSEAPGPMNFTLFLTLFMEKLSSMHTQNTFTCFGEKTSGFVHKDHPKRATRHHGQQFPR